MSSRSQIRSPGFTDYLAVCLNPVDVVEAHLSILDVFYQLQKSGVCFFSTEDLDLDDEKKRTIGGVAPTPQLTSFN